MKVEVFDDLHSLGHLILGFLTAIIPFLRVAIVMLFILYEIVEFMYKYGVKKKREPVENFIGDILEYFLGLGFGAVVVWSI